MSAEPAGPRARLRGVSALAARLPDGRLHLQHGPIDLVIAIDGEAAAVAAAERRAVTAFGPVLETLVDELGALRTPVAATSGACDPHAGLRGPVARRMAAAVRPWRPAFVTPMAAVAGAVADHVLAAAIGDPGHEAGAGASDGAASLRRVSVNDGGDIALWLAPGERYRVGLCTDPRTGALAGRAELAAGDGVGGIATSGRLGRSRSLGIADAVTVLAAGAASADVAATLIANAVDLSGSARVVRVPANELDADTDLGDRPVTVEVAPLSAAQRREALEAAVPVAREALRRGLALAAVASLQGEVRELAGTVSGALGASGARRRSAEFRL